MEGGSSRSPARLGPCPAQLIVGGRSDEAFLRLNSQAQQQPTCENKLMVIPGAFHLFEEPGTLEQVAELAVGWFTRHLVTRAAGTVPPAGPNPLCG